MPIELSAAELLPAVKKLEGLQAEVDQLEIFLKEDPLETSRNSAWRHAGLSYIATSVHNAYNGIEDVMRLVCKSIDGHVPDGPSSHQDVLNQMATGRKGIRPPLLDEAMFQDLQDLKAFRHRVNHNYSNELIDQRVMENVERLRRTYPLFIAAVVALDEHLTKEEEPPVEDPFTAPK